MPPISRNVEHEYQDRVREVLTGDEKVMTDDKAKDQNLKEFKTRIVWRNVILMASLHIGALIGAYRMLTVAKYQTVIAWFVFYVFSGIY